MNKWNGKRFSIYDNEEKQMLGLVKNLGDQTNYNTDEVERLTISDNKKVSHEEMNTKYKIDENANFEGSWFGIKKPTESNEGLGGAVEQILNEVIPNINKNLQELNKHSITSLYNVKDYGAKGDGITDDWNAINSVIELIKNTGGTIFFPTGIYAISKPLSINVDGTTLLHNIVLQGLSSNIPYFNSYGENPNKLAMNSNIIPTSNFSGEGLIIFGKCANTLVENLALIGSPNNLSARTIKGIVYKANVSNNSVRYCCIQRCTTGIDGNLAPILKVEYTNIQYCKDIGILIRGDSRIVECEISSTGMQLYGVSGEGSTTNIFAPSGYYGGSAILVVDNGANCNIIGGLIDWNCKGIVCDASSGLLVNGVRFHHNAECHIWFRARGGGLGSLGCNISGCKFLGGGFMVGSLDTKCAIKIVNDASFTSTLYGNITGNTFRVGDWDATENSDAKINSPTATTGPISPAIICATTNNVDLTVSANDMINCSLGGAFAIAQNGSGTITKIKSLGNNINKLGFTTGKAYIYENYDVANYNGKPNWTGIEGETSKNTSTKIFKWNNYVYSGSMWYGKNQTNIQYDTTQNRPAMDGYTDRGFEYFDTTIGKRIVWDGVTWRDLNGTSV